MKRLIFLLAIVVFVLAPININVSDEWVSFNGPTQIGIYRTSGEWGISFDGYKLFRWAISEAQTFTVQKDGVQVYSFTCPGGPVPVPCVYTYSTTCVNGKTHEVVSSTPSGCTGTPDPSQACGGIPSSWISLNNRIGTRSFFGYNGAWAGSYLSLTGLQTYWLYIDPSVSGGSVHNPQIVVGDTAQLVPISAILYRLNPDYSINRSVPMTCGNNQCGPRWPKDDPYKDGEKLVVKVIPSAGIAECIAYWGM